MERKTYTITGISPRTGKRYTITTVTPHGRGSDQVTDAMKRARENGWTDVKVGIFKWGKTVEELSAAAKAKADALEGNPVDPDDPWDLRGGAADEWKFLSGKLAEANAELEAQKQRTQDAYGGRMPASSHHAIQVLTENRDRWQQSVDNFTEDYPNIVKGNAAEVPGGVETAADGTLHGMLSDVADHIDYEAKVVDAAADQLPDDDEVGKLATKQANKMADAAEAVNDAAAAAATTTAEVFNETGVAQHDQKDGEAGEVAAEITGGNPADGGWKVSLSEFGWNVGRKHGSGDFARVEMLTDDRGGVAQFGSKREAQAEANRLNGITEGNPMGEYRDFADCVAQNQDKDDPEAYCGAIKHNIEGNPGKEWVTPWAGGGGGKLREYSPEQARKLIAKLDAGTAFGPPGIRRILEARVTGGNPVKIIGYTYEADIHTPEETFERFGPEPAEGYDVAGITDGEGNPPHPIFSTDELEPGDYERLTEGNPASEAYQAGHDRGEQYEGLDPEDVPDPLSGEFAGESMPELLGSDFTDEDADDYEEGYWDAVVGNPTMTRQHFQLIADVLKRLPADQQRSVAEAFADELAATNPRFDRERFLAAAISKGNPVSAEAALIPEAGADSTILAEAGLPAANVPSSAVTPDTAPTPAHWYTRPIFAKGR